MEDKEGPNINNHVQAVELMHIRKDVPLLQSEQGSP
jgi:hypothetical protein